ncbi:MAG: sugar ABC transporter permease [Eubacteriales bacterium]|nr:sugar ABC transporter permease [Christensenellaceae bacterium]MEA5066732.1 sugar ABC transporter permease [Eubacteriales bacterium]
MDNQRAIARRHKQWLWIAFFVAPGLLVVGVFILLPLFMSLANSLFSWNQLIRGDFVGLENFRNLFTAYPFKERFYNALGNNVKWFLSTMLIQNTVSLLIGYVMSRQIRGSQVYRRLIFIPVMFSIVAVSYLWGLYMRPSGLLNTFLRAVGLNDLALSWLGDGKVATYSIIAVNIWRWIGFPSLVFMTAIDAVDEELIEASTLDGAGEWRTFWKVVFPLIIPSITVITVLTIIGSLNVFEQVYTMAGLDGPPNYATDTISTLFYRTAFGSVDSGAPQIGMGSAIAVIIYVVTFFISLLSIWVTRSKEVQV